MKVVAMNISFNLALVWPHSKVYNSRYDQNNTQWSTWSCSFQFL